MNSCRRQLIQGLVGHDVRTVQQQGWAGLKNGTLLRQAGTAGFQIFLTSDQNLEFQQNISNCDLFVVVMVSHTNRIEDLLPLLPEVLAAIARARSGELVRIEKLPG